MKKPGKTKTGLVWPYPSERQDNLDRLLYDFDIDDAELKIKHKLFLDEALAFMRTTLSTSDDGKRPYWKITLDGYTSKTGDWDHNQTLSEQRENSVYSYLNDRLSAFGLSGGYSSMVTWDTNFHGFDQTKVTGEDETGRSVRVVIDRPQYKILSPPAIIKPKSRLQKNFYIQWVAGGSGITPIGIQVDVIVLHISDMDRALTGKFIYTGAGLGIPMEFLPPITLTTSPGDPKWFGAECWPPSPPELYDFRGAASFIQPTSAGPLSAADAMLNIKSHDVTMKSILFTPDPVEVPSGFAPNAGLFSSSEGRLELSGSLWSIPPGTVFPPPGKRPKRWTTD